MSRRTVLLGLVSVTATSLGACSEASSQPTSMSGLRIMAPAGKGGGWDKTSRAMQDVLEKEGLASGTEVYNVEGTGGVNGLNELVGETDDKLLMTTGLVMVGAIEYNKSVNTLANVTPIARTVSENQVLVITKAVYDSGVHNVLEVFGLWRSDTTGTAIAGGSAGGSDQILVGLMADQIGIDPSAVRYIANSGGGKALEKLRSGEAKIGVSGISEFLDQIRSGELFAVGVSGERRSTLLPDVKTLREQGVGISFSNWRALVAPRNISAAAKARLVDLVTKMHDTRRWSDAMAANDWQDYFLTGPAFDKFLANEVARTRKLLRQVEPVK